MKNKTALVLLEQIIMVTVFALAAAICLKAFVWADSVSRRNETMDNALMQVQNMAEYIKHTEGDLNGCAAALGGTVENDRWVWEVDGYAVTAVPLEPNMRYLGTAELTAIDDSGTVLATLQVAYQEVERHG